MAVKIKTASGTIEISNDVIATVVGGATTDIYGIVGMASKNQIKDNLNEILKKKIMHEESLCVKKRMGLPSMSIRLLVTVQKSQKCVATFKKKCVII